MSVELDLINTELNREPFSRRNSVSLILSLTTKDYNELLELAKSSDSGIVKELDRIKRTYNLLNI